MNTVHTDGEWKWHWRFEDGVATGSVFAEPLDGQVYAVAICPRYQSEAQWRADAALISQAKNMLAMLKLALEVIPAVDDYEYTPSAGAARDGINHVIAKAEGSTT